MNPERQWVEKRSAMEIAKFWTVVENQTDFLMFLRTTDDELSFNYAIPEITTRFDDAKK
ncbi:hypothetical protein D3C85_1493610 [compost metagenome]